MAVKGVIKVPFNGQMVDAIELDFQPVTEPWSEYELMDGGRLRTRSTVARVFWMVDAKGIPMRDADGQAMILLHHQEQMVVQA